MLISPFACCAFLCAAPADRPADHDELVRKGLQLGKEFLAAVKEIKEDDVPDEVPKKLLDTGRAIEAVRDEITRRPIPKEKRFEMIRKSGQARSDLGKALGKESTRLRPNAKETATFKLLKSVEDTIDHLFGRFDKDFELVVDEMQATLADASALVTDVKGKDGIWEKAEKLRSLTERFASARSYAENLLVTKEGLFSLDHSLRKSLQETRHKLVGELNRLSKLSGTMAMLAEGTALSDALIDFLDGRYFSAEMLLAELQTVLGSATDALENVTDKESAAAAVPRMQSVQRQLSFLRTRLDRQVSAQRRDELEAKYSKPLEKVGFRFGTEMARVRNIEGTEALTKAVTKLLEVIMEAAND